MPQLMKVKCNNAERHVNEIDLEKLLRSTPVLRGRSGPVQQNTPERLVLRCQHCAEGKVIITRQMVETFRGTLNA